MLIPVSVNQQRFHLYLHQKGTKPCLRVKALHSSEGQNGLVSVYSGKYERLSLEYFTSGNISRLRRSGLAGGARVREKMLRYDPNYSRI